VCSIGAVADRAAAKYARRSRVGAEGLTVPRPFQIGLRAILGAARGRRKPAVSSGFQEAGDGARTHDPQLGKLDQGMNG